MLRTRFPRNGEMMIPLLSALVLFSATTSCDKCSTTTADGHALRLSAGHPLSIAGLPCPAPSGFDADFLILLEAQRSGSRRGCELVTAREPFHDLVAATTAACADLIDEHATDWYHVRSIAPPSSSCPFISTGPPAAQADVEDSKDAVLAAEMVHANVCSLWPSAASLLPPCGGTPSVRRLYAAAAETFCGEQAPNALLTLKVSPLRSSHADASSAAALGA